MKVLQVGLGGFGKNHVRAWSEMGLRNSLWVAELRGEGGDDARALGLDPSRVVSDYRALLKDVDVVDVVTPSTSHYEICSAALAAGCDVFVEKPATMTSSEAEALREQASSAGKLIQVGYYYRYHPLSTYLKAKITDGSIGKPRYISGVFMGFKRCRNDVGVTHTDGIHFIDLFNWLLGEMPTRVYAVIRDHFGRGMEDLSIVMLDYPSGAVGKVESGYIQPGRWRDKVVAGAFTSKEIFVSGSTATVEVDFETEMANVHDVHHELRNGIWTAVNAGTTKPLSGTANTVQLISSELNDFLECVRSRRTPSANIEEAGVQLGRVIEAVYESAKTGQPATVHANKETVA